MLFDAVSPGPLYSRNQSRPGEDRRCQPINQEDRCPPGIEGYSPQIWREYAEGPFLPGAISQDLLILGIAKPKVNLRHFTASFPLAETLNNSHHEEHSQRIPPILGIIPHIIAVECPVVNPADP